MKALFLLGLSLGLSLAGALAGAVTTQTVTVTWSAPTQHTDNTPITGALTYNLYQGNVGAAPVLKQAGIVGLTVTRSGMPTSPQQCFTVSAVEGGKEGPQSASVCADATAAAPGAPIITKVSAQ